MGKGDIQMANQNTKKMLNFICHWGNTKAKPQ